MFMNFKSFAQSDSMHFGTFQANHFRSLLEIFDAVWMVRRISFWHKLVAHTLVANASFQFPPALYH